MLISCAYWTHLCQMFSVWRRTLKRCEEATNGPRRCQIKALIMLRGRPALTAGGELMASLSCVANVLTGNRCWQMFGKLHLREPLSSQVHAALLTLHTAKQTHNHTHTPFTVCTKTQHCLLWHFGPSLTQSRNTTVHFICDFHCFLMYIYKCSG